jgi:hypothetical protein
VARKKEMTFNDALSRFRTVIMNRIRKNKTVSAVDILDNVPSVTGSRRGAIVRRAFESLIEDGKIKRTSDTVYNHETHHSVTVYKTK